MVVAVVERVALVAREEEETAVVSRRFVFRFLSRREIDRSSSPLKRLFSPPLVQVVLSGASMESLFPREFLIIDLGDPLYLLLVKG